MSIDSIQTQGPGISAASRLFSPAEQVDQQRQMVQDPSLSDGNGANKLQSEELLQQIKAITENGSYSVRFEQDDASHKLVVKIVDSITDEVIRQIPPEELLSLTKRLRELQGNLVDTVS